MFDPILTSAFIPLSTASLMIASAVCAARTCANDVINIKERIYNHLFRVGYAYNCWTFDKPNASLSTHSVFRELHSNMMFRSMFLYNLTCELDHIDLVSPVPDRFLTLMSCGLPYMSVLRYEPGVYQASMHHYQVYPLAHYLSAWPSRRSVEFCV